MAHINSPGKESDQLNFMATSVVYLIIVYAVIVFKLCIGRLVKNQLKLHDKLMVMVLMTFTGIATFASLTISWNGKQQAGSTTNPSSMSQIKLKNKAIYRGAMMVVKSSILMLYYNIFPQRWLRSSVIGVLSFASMWILSSFLPNLLRCSLSKSPSTMGSDACLEYGTVVFGFGIMSVISDLWIIGLPVGMVWFSQISDKEKRYAILAFLGGFTSCVIGTVQLAWSDKTSGAFDSGWDTFGVGVMYAQLIVGIMAVSVLAFRSLYVTVVGHSPLLRELFYQQQAPKTLQRDKKDHAMAPTNG